MELLGSYHPKQAADFILWLANQQREESLYEMWLHSMSDLGFEEFKNKQMKSTPENRHKRKKINKEKEQAALANASAVLGKAIGKGGGSD